MFISKKIYLIIIDMKKNMFLPFTVDMKGGNNKSFKILNDTQINAKLKKKSTILNFIKSMITQNSNNANNNKLEYVKASETKEYYKKINSNKK